jgi:glycerophosphoryl diester phosphodiesterase
MQRAADGTLWIGDEFGPFLLHTDASGKVLEAPIPVPDPDGHGDLRSPQNPFNEEATTVRVLNALHARGAAHGASHRPILSPEAQLLADKNPSTSIASRDAPPATSGLSHASSEIIDVDSMHRAGYKVVTWTVDDEPTMRALATLKVDGLISDRPDVLRTVAESFDGNGDGKPDFIDADGLIDVTRFDAQGHRGGRDLRPENTLPAFEVALDEHMTTLELDIGITSDGEPLISHDPFLSAQKCRRADGSTYDTTNQILIKDGTRAELQTTLICDKLFRGPTQKNDASLSPVTAAFVGAGGIPQAYAPPSLGQLFGFVAEYIKYYETGAGVGHPDAARRVKNAKRVRFNIETKINPRAEYRARTTTPERFVDVIASTLGGAGLTERATLQSFDARSLLLAQDRNIDTVLLVGDFPVFADRGIGTDEGTNLQPDEGTTNTPWFAGMVWPYRQTTLDRPFRVKASGGLESLAKRPGADVLIAMLEKPLLDATTHTLLAFEFDIATRAFTGKRWTYELDASGVSVAEFQLIDATHGLVLERDDKQGDLSAFKSLTAVSLGTTTMGKARVADLMQIADPSGISKTRLSAEDVGVGDPYAMPFTTIESFVVLDTVTPTVLIANDNNLPFGRGRHVRSGKPDDTEFVKIRTGALIP